ncbi:hypothetical protein [Dietzia sp. 179-F 9C3 NHS]|uniref:hypothetical protein n=1 Tax=Dietzia sp. 179-F 9C3 NHS TaxID=3374295 RepID=UPI003879A6C2
MGSISYAKTPGRTTDQELRAYLAENLHPGHRIVAQATRPTFSGGYGEWSRELFAAVDDGDGNVTCHVLLGASHSGDIVIKALHETMGPNENPDPPRRVLDALTPTSNRCALVFREMAREALQRKDAAKAMAGYTIEFDIALDYGGGWGKLTRFTVESMTRFTGPDGCGRFRAPAAWWMRNWVVVDGPAFAA